MERRQIREKLVDALEAVVTFAYGWFTENKEALGRVTYFWHLYILFTVFMFILMSHLVYPVLWFQIIVFIACAIVWIQHICLHFCICTSLEIRLSGPNAPIAIDYVLDFFNIPVNRESRIGVTILITTLMTGFLGLELIARGILGLRRKYGFSTLA